MSSQRSETPVTHHRCPHCSYDLSATPAERPCPECGRHSPRLQLATFANLAPRVLRDVRRMVNLLALATTLDVLALATTLDVLSLATLFLTESLPLTAAPAIVALVLRLTTESTLGALRPLMAPFRRPSRPGFLNTALPTVDGGAIVLVIASMWITGGSGLFWSLFFPALIIIRMLIIIDLHAGIGPYSIHRRRRATVREAGTWTCILGLGTLITMPFCVGYAIAIVTIPLLLAIQLASGVMICREVARQLGPRPPSMPH